MTLEQYAALGELIGGIGVIFTLIYLAYQIRQNSKSVRSSTLAINTQTWTALITSTVEPGIIETYIKGSIGKGDLTAEEFSRFFYLCRALFVNMETQWFQYTNGTLEADIFKGYERSIRRQVVTFRGFRRYWKMCRDEFSPDFMTYMDKLFADIPEQAPAHLIEQWQRLAQQDRAA